MNLPFTQLIDFSFAFAADEAQPGTFIKLNGPLTGLTAPLQIVTTTLLLNANRHYSLSGSHFQPGDEFAFGRASDLSVANVPLPSSGDYLVDSTGKIRDVIAAAPGPSGHLIHYHLRRGPIDYATPEDTLHADDYGSLAAATVLIDYDE